MAGRVEYCDAVSKHHIAVYQYLLIGSNVFQSVGNIPRDLKWMKIFHRFDFRSMKDKTGVRIERLYTRRSSHQRSQVLNVQMVERDVIDPFRRYAESLQVISDFAMP